MVLSEYSKKRKFRDTPEPVPKSKEQKSEKLVFVVQKHQSSHLHFDFRLEMEGVLKSWAIPKGPTMDPQIKRLAIETEDHPYDYKDFEGVIPAGNYGAGTVEIWDKGNYQAENGGESVLIAGYKNGHISLILEGEKLKGKFSLVRTKNDEKKQWLFFKNPYDFLGEIKMEAPESPMPHHVSPMLATLTEEAFDSDDFIFEIKWDGYRAIAEVSRYGVNLYSRNQISFNKTFEEIVDALANIKHEAVLDGEVVILDENGASKFQLMQQYKKTKKGNLIYYIFDILFLDGYDLKELPLIERKKILKEVIGDSPYLKFGDYIKKDGIKFFELAVSQGLEGIIGKKRDSPYRMGKRTREWLKIKTHLRQEAVIGGFTEPRGGRKYFGALVLGLYDKGKLRYVGHTGGGFDDEKLEYIYSKLKPLESNKSPFEKIPKTNTRVHWIKPEISCEVSFTEWTADRNMRQPIFLGLKEEKKISTVGNGKSLKLTNLKKNYFPEDNFTKGDVIEYYKKISDLILPYLKDRPQSLLRMPDGINGKRFFQKDIDVAVEGIKTQPIYSDSEDRRTNYIIGNDEKTLIYIINLGCIELNPWLSRIQNLDNPDFMVLDLDPENIQFKEVIKTAKVLKNILDSVDVKAYIKTSGKTGLHIFIPLNSKYSYEQIKQFGEIIARIVNKQLPDVTSTERMPEKRKKKVYIDFLQNRKGQTITPPYSLRPVKGLQVSTPLKWEELEENIKPADFTVNNIFERIEKYGDLFKPVLSEKTDLLKALNKLSELV